MCRDTGYYEPRDDVAVKVVEEMVEKKTYQKTMKKNLG